MYEPTKELPSGFIMKCYETGDETEIIMGSIRSDIDIVDAQLAGAHIVTAGLPHYIKMSEHPGTTASVDQFMTDFEEWLT